MDTQYGIWFRIKSTLRRQLESFDFMDVATDENPFWPRMTTIQASGRCWVDFTRATHAVTLFGTGFGDLIRPSRQGAVVRITSQFACQRSKTFCRKGGARTLYPGDWSTTSTGIRRTRLSNYALHSCLRPNTIEYKNCFQLPPPKLWGRGLTGTVDISLAPRGALLFGHSWRFPPPRWKDQGAPEEGNPDQEMENIQISLQDNRIGTSLGFSSIGAAGGSSPCSLDSGLSSSRERDISSTIASQNTDEHLTKRSRLLTQSIIWEAPSLQHFIKSPM
ncbi:uncharacterized protein BCR38DRAFT_410303 [Pseudomassariella vexata]|uniref:Uncharacterized protein n=1 Tax=Pseudomassariella vexata TaxID=1141098 RepID=A0A1Y2DVP8_9PEZI|nr:uncharacterized protein BCR38DRAFT_410303 [Pseudomassariella vexata]ORY63370.1 hypothetical protein BCR38DRAFT_410303 [Pseudomassariella vexata]